MIQGMHAMFYSSEPEELRAFLRDTLELPFTDTGGGWLIFDLPEADLGVHPSDRPELAAAGTHEISFYCEDIEATVAELKSRGVKFTADISDQGFGLVTFFEMPGGVEVELYQPAYEKD